MKRQIEIFTAGCPVCEPVVQLVKETAGKDCSRVPAIAVNGKLLNCCTKIEITKEDLVNAGIGSC